MRNFSFLIIIAVLALLPFVSGCSGSPPQMKYYQLSATSFEVPETDRMPDLVLGVGPILVPEMLKRQEIVVRDTNNQYQLGDIHRWAGMLEKDLLTIMVENLGHLLGTEKVVSFPWSSYFTPDYRVTVEIIHLSGQPGGQATLRASWTIVDSSGENVLVRKISEYQQQSGDQSYDSMVMTESQLVGQLCEEISKTLRGLKR